MEEVIETRVCTKCLERHPVEFFNKDRTRPDGLYPQCKNCSRRACRTVYRKYHDKHVAAKRAWKDENRDRHNQINKTWAAANPDKTREYIARWWRANREKAYAQSRAYRAALKAATPPWVDEALLRLARKETPEGYVLDHIDPIRHEHLCGLNVPWNLQVLGERENCSKRNSVNFDDYKLIGEGGLVICATR